MRDREPPDGTAAAVVVHATPGVEALVAETLREAGLEADIGDAAFSKSLEAPHSVLLDVESWFRTLWPWSLRFAWPVAQKGL